MSQPIRDQSRHLVFPIGPKNINLVEDIESLLPVKFRWIPFSGFRGEVENVSANQRPGRPSCFLIGLKNTNLLEDIEILLPVKFRWILFSGVRGEVENVSANQRPGRPSYFSDRPEKHKLIRGCWDLASCQVSLNSVQQFQRRSRKMWKVNDRRTTDNGQLPLRCTKYQLESSIDRSNRYVKNRIFYFSAQTYVHTPIDKGQFVQGLLYWPVGQRSWSCTHHSSEAGAVWAGFLAWLCRSVPSFWPAMCWSS